MDYVTEKESTKRAPMRPVEANYVNADIHNIADINDTDVFNPQTGFQFTFPSKWATYPSSNKLVGIRRLSYYPCAMNVGFTIYTFSGDVEEIDTSTAAFDEDDGCYTYYKTETTTNDNGEEESKEVEYYYEPTLKRTRTNAVRYGFVFDAGTTIYDAIGTMDNDMNDDAEEELDYITQLKYDADSLSFTMKTMKFDEDTNTFITIPFKLIFDEEINQYAENFLKLLNQPISDATIAEIKQANEESINFTNVWNRDDLYFHASFSDSARQLIGFQHDMWPDANVYYSCSLNSDDFTIRFTQDGVSKILPRNGVLLIQFSLIYNYANSFLM